jgi:hypothetical protein
MTRTLEELETLVRERICGVCTERTAGGECGLEDPGSCALFRLFPQDARAIESTNSDDIRDYIQAIRGRVCSVCTQQDSDGVCLSRKEVACALDAYLILVIGVIEEATGKSFDRSNVAIPPNPAPGAWVISPS